MGRFLSSSVVRSARFTVTLVLPVFVSIVTAVTVKAADLKPIPHPHLDLNDLGRVALVGNFDAISIYEFEGQNQNNFVRNGSDTLLSRFPNGEFNTLVSADATISTMCTYFTKDGDFGGVVVGGNFTSLGGTPAQGIALYHPESNEVESLTGLHGEVTSLLCDKETGVVYVGGSFKAAHSTNAISWAGNWAELPFEGFNGPVTSIVKSINDGKIVFGGQFDGLGNTTTPKKPDVQVIPVDSADVTAGPSASDPQFSDPKNIICKTGATDGPGNTWLGADNQPTFWDAKFGFGFVPTKVRLYNTEFGDHGTETFRMTYFPGGGILNLTYFDEEGVKQFCDSQCHLPQNNNSFVDFHMVNPVGMNEFRLDISSWYGSSAGLAGIELFQDDIFSFAVNRFNEPKCDGVSLTSASASATGPWSVSPSFSSQAEYLTATLTDSTIDSDTASVVFKPNIEQSGNYSITVYTPGCVDDGSCGTRGRVNMTGLLAPSSTDSGPSTFETQLYQTNDFYKYDEIFVGYVQAGSDAFQPTVTLAPSSGQTGPLTAVAQRVHFELRSSTGGLNGLFEFNPDKLTINTDFSTSAINKAGTDLRDEALVQAMTVQGDTIYVVGDFATNQFSNVFSLSGNKPQSLAGNGLDSEIITLYDSGSKIYMGGDFKRTKDGSVKDLNGVCAYSPSDDTWEPLGAGVDGPVTAITPISVNITAGKPEDVLLVNGNFNKLQAFKGNSAATADGFAIWVPSENNWLNNLDLSTLYISGSLSSFTALPQNQDPIFAGSVSSQMLGASGAVRLVQGGAALEAFDLTIEPQGSEASSVKSRSLSSQDFTGVTTGLFHMQSGLNLTIYGGHFTAEATDGSTIQNLMFLDGKKNDKITGLDDSIDADSKFMTLATQGNTLFAGGAISGKVGSNTVGGILFYDLKNMDYTSSQPPALQGNHVAVNSITLQPDTGNVFVGGDFNSAGDFDCPSLCVFDTKISQWKIPGQGLTGVVSSLLWTGDSEMVVTGDLQVNGKSASIVKYNADDQTFEEFDDASKIPGTITALTLGNGDGSELWVAGQSDDGSPFVMKFDGSQWQSAGDGLADKTSISGLQVFSVTEDHDDTDLLPGDEVLLIVGQVDVKDFGNASAVLYDGQKYTPFILSTTAANTPGYLSSVFVQKPQNFFTTENDQLAIGLVVLIALAIALALTAITVVAGFMAEHWRRKRQGYMPAPTMSLFDRSANLNRVPPEELLSGVDREAGYSGPRL